MAHKRAKKCLPMCPLRSAPRKPRRLVCWQDLLSHVFDDDTIIVLYQAWSTCCGMSRMPLWAPSRAKCLRW